MMSSEMVVELTRLMNCLVSRDAGDDLYSRFNDEDLRKNMNGLTEELADLGINWWAKNPEILTEIIDMFKEDLSHLAHDKKLDINSSLMVFYQSFWSDFIRECFYFAGELVEGIGNPGEVKEFIKYAVIMSLEYSGEDSLLNEDEMEALEVLFSSWWASGKPFTLFTRVHELTKEGCALLNS